MSKAADKAAPASEGLLTREQILGVEDRPAELVDVPEWGGRVRVQTMTGAARDQVEQQLQRSERADTGMRENVRAIIVAGSVVGDDGALLFTAADVEQLGAKSALALDRVFDVAARLSGFRESDIEELEKN